MKALGIVEVPVFTMGVVEFIPYAKYYIHPKKDDLTPSKALNDQLKVNFTQGITRLTAVIVKIKHLENSYRIQ